MSRHVLDIEPRRDGLIRALLTFDDGSQVELCADERARVIAKAQREVERFERVRAEARRFEWGETLLLDEHGELVPGEWPVRT